jgi:hypothetical protein
MKCPHCDKDMKETTYYEATIEDKKRDTLTFVECDNGHAFKVVLKEFVRA